MIGNIICTMINRAVCFIDQDFVLRKKKKKDFVLRSHVRSDIMINNISHQTSN